ncbi:MAG: leucine--tRNA ligase [Candidatus Odinarchaeia archaeon]
MLDWKLIESKWQEKWLREKIFEANPDERKKVFVTFPYAYMNGPLHLGHALTCLRVDIYARFKRMQGYNVLFPFAFHATGEPIVGVAERIKKGDKKQVEILISGGVEEKEIEKFKDPEYIVEYYRRKAIEAANSMGFSIDWRRQFTTIDDPYKKFIEWQYITLKNKGYVAIGTHPVIWCPADKSPTGDHDRLVGEGVSPIEYILIKFKYGDSWLVMATLRPETIFGVVNIWVNPNATYVIANVDGENWIISESAALKLKEQKKKVEVIDKFKGADLIGRYATNPITHTEVPILPAEFVDPDNATGVVMSVPSHAPYDWLGLLDLKRNPEELEKYGVDPALVEEIKPISLIETPGLGEHPAIEIVEKLKIKNQKDPRAEDATKEVYKKEFHLGVLKENTGKYAGIPVREIKDTLTEDLIKEGLASTMWETADKVVCRCGTKCIVKILENQWFLRYSDPEWKKIAHEVLNNAIVLPEEARSAFEYTIEWLTDKACARRTGLGTKLPWDKEWIVETLSDSTIYMAFYTIAHYINTLNIPAEKLVPAVFDYIFLNKGDVNEVAKISGLSKDVLEKMWAEFHYWYPVDLRNSAKELIYNHLTFFIFHHGAIFPKEHWPKMIGVNGMINIEGQKMSKSRGIFITIEDAVKTYGADPTRLELAYSAEGVIDPDWRAKDVEGLKNKLEAFYKFATNLPETGNYERKIDEWLISKLNQRIKATTEHFERLEYRSGLQEGFFNLYNDIKWYMRRADKPSWQLIRAVETVVKLIAPVVPHISEEIWEKLGKQGFVSLEEWPKYDEKLINPKLDSMEELIKRSLEDIREIIKVTKIQKPSEITLFVAPKWKYKIYDMALESTADLIRRIMQESDIRKYGEEAVKYAKKLLKTKGNLMQFALTYEEEFETLKNAADFIKREFGAESVNVLSAEGQSNEKARIAEPGKPGIYII